jgi:hypothetical protein
LTIMPNFVKAVFFARRDSTQEDPREVGSCQVRSQLHWFGREPLDAW